ncbi:MAG: type II toxin-antitoxin system HicB family antitoxin [Clostridiales bacterium]|nr:type II toxin-antitoxin system HicB family antitoxin [Clostridiales bacterium]
MSKYEIVIYWSKSDNCFLAEAPELPGCIADGKTLNEAAENVEIIIKEWIECAILDGDEIPVPKERFISAV